MTEALRAIRQWYALADQQDKIALYDRVGVADVARRRAALYRDTARAMRLGLETGQTWCACHLLPEAEWPKHASRR